jgi:hypothetical protein
MTKANHDRNFIKLGTTKKDDREWDRLEDRLQTDPNLGGGGPPQLIVPGTYVPQVGLPPGIPYVYVIGNLLEGYPIDLTLTGDLRPDFELSLDLGNYFGLGADAIIGKSPINEVVVYKIPNSPIIIPGVGLPLQKIVSSSGMLFEAPGRDGDTLRSRQPDFTWDEYDITTDFGYPQIAAGEGSDVSGCLLLIGNTSSTQIPPAPLPATSFLLTYDLIAVDDTGNVTHTEEVSVLRPASEINPNCGVIENGWLLIVSSGVGFALGQGTMWARPSVVTESAPMVNIGKVFTSSTAQLLSNRNMSIGPTGIAWVSYLPDGSGNIGGVVRADLITGQIQRYQGILYDSTLSYEVTIEDTVYISDTVCAVSGYYQIPAVTQVPVVVFLSLAPDGGFTVTQLEFPDYSGTFSTVANMVKLPGNMLVFHLHSGSLDLTGQPASILFSVDTSTVSGS